MVKSKAQTMMGLDADLKEAAAALQRCNPTAISLKAGCALFLRYTTRSSALEDEDFASAKARIIEVTAYAGLPTPELQFCFVTQADLYANLRRGLSCRASTSSQQRPSPASGTSRWPPSRSAAGCNQACAA